MNKIFLLLISFILFSSSALYAKEYTRISPTVPIESPLYDDLDLLVAHGLIKTLIQGHRPLTRGEIARLLTEAQTNFEAKTGASVSAYSSANKKDRFAYTASLIKKLSQSFDTIKPKYSVHPVDTLTADVTLLDSPSHPYFFRSDIDGRFNPLVAYQGGRHLVDGTQYAFESTHWALLGNHFSAHLHPRMQVQLNNNTADDETKPFIHELYISAGLANTQFDLGRKSLQWGQGRLGGIVLSNNARPFDGIFISNPSPWKIPVIRHLKYGFFFGTLGPEQLFKNPYISGMKLSFLPHPNIEFGITRALIFGGEGSPTASFGKMFVDYFGIRKGSEINTLNLSNGFNGFELRGRIPALRGLELYSEIYFDDFGTEHAFRSIKEDAGITAGIYLPRLDNRGTWSLRVEGQKNSPLLYEHDIWETGWVVNKNTLGNALGPDAESLHITVSKRWGSKTRFTNELAYDRLDSDVYAKSGPTGFVLLTDNPSEQRFRNTFAIHHEFSDKVTGQATVGYERVNGFNFVQGQDRNNWLLGLKLNLSLDKVTRYEKN